MSLYKTCPNCNGVKMVEAKSIVTGQPEKRLCMNCFRTGGRVPSDDGMEILVFLKQFKNWVQYEIVDGEQVEVEPK